MYRLDYSYNDAENKNIIESGSNSAFEYEDDSQNSKVFKNIFKIVFLIKYKIKFIIFPNKPLFNCKFSINFFI